ncbi:MAG: hypothetical protein WCT22_03260 [Patescibacteria group bacterium]
MKYKSKFFIPHAVSFSELEEQFNLLSQQNPNSVCASWEYKFGAYYMLDFESIGNLAILDRAIDNGFFTTKDISVIKKIREDQPLNYAERKRKERLIKKSRQFFDVADFN